MSKFYSLVDFLDLFGDTKSPVMTNFAGCPVLIVLLHLQHLVLSTKMFPKKNRENSLQNDPPGTRGSTEKSNRPGSGQLQLHWGQLRPGASSSKLQSHDHVHTSS